MNRSSLAVYDYWHAKSIFSVLFQVNVQKMCNTGTGLSNLSALYPTIGLLETMKDNRGTNPALKWQYFGSESGVLTTYPAHKTCNNQYDPRFR